MIKRNSRIGKQIEKKEKSETVPHGLLRVEIIMLDRVLMKLFGERERYQTSFRAKDFRCS
jgi:hypothetical protein